MKTYRTIILLFIILALILHGPSLAEELKMSTDLTEVGIGARPMGFGGAFVGLADDASAIFKNPAGIGLLKRPNFMSMSTQLLSSINYTVAGFAYPTEYGVFGIGYIGAEMPAGTHTYMSGGITVEEGAIYFQDNLYILSYGCDITNNVGSTLYLEEDSKMSFGVNMKVLSKGFSGSLRNVPSARGFQVDLGVLYRTVDKVSLGLTLTNVWRNYDGEPLLVWNTGETERMPHLLKIGFSYMPITNVTFAVDSDVDIDDNANAILRCGTEWQAVPNLALRAGFRQIHSSIDDQTTGILTDLTVGVGFQASGYRFDYAFMQDSVFSTISTHYFSICFTGIDDMTFGPKETPLEHFENVIEKQQSTPEGR